MHYLSLDIDPLTTGSLSFPPFYPDDYCDFDVRNE
jgi:hypothetical protein